MLYFLGEEVDILKGHKDKIIKFVFSPNGKQIISCSKDNTVRIWPFDTGLSY